MAENTDPNKSTSRTDSQNDLKTDIIQLSYKFNALQLNNNEEKSHHHKPTQSESQSKINNNAFILKKERTNNQADSEEGLHLCGICNVMFPSLKLLKDHAIRKHINEKKHASNVSSEPILYQNALATRENGYSEQESDACAICDIKFRQKGQLLKHVFLFSGKKPHTCTVCGNDFNQNNNSEPHVHSHSGMQSCVTCNNMFSHKDKLLNYVFKPSAKIPRSCDTCDQIYKHRRSLVKRERTEQ